MNAIAGGEGGGLRDRDVDGALEGVVALCCVCGMRGEEGLTWETGVWGR